RIAGATAGANWTPASGLTTIEELGSPVRTRRIVLSFDSAMGMWVLDGKHFDPNRIDARPRLGTTEVWELFNDNTGGKTSMTHPFHMHLVQFRVLERGRDGVFVSPPANERGWKDTVRIEPGETVRFAARFGEFTGNYMYHCHIFEHEDHSMMAQMRVVDLARFSGIGRVETAAAASAATFSPGVSAVFVSTSDNFPDALAAGPVAAGKGPVLLTSGGSLPSATRAEIERLRPAKAFVLGGPSVVPAAVEEELRSLVPVVERLAGNDRYETAAAVAAAFFTRPVPIAYVASGRGFADALAGGAAAASLGGPMLLTEANALPPATGAALRNLAPGRIVLLGGPLAVGEAVENALREIAPTTRISGGDRYATAAAVVRDAFQGPVPALAVATGEAFPDALAGVPVASSLGGPLVLVPKSAPLPAAVRALIESLRPGAIRVLGGEGAVPAEVEEALAELL
ncbi:MAG: cell wall-binding repeat-containing protein, partial [Acidimicrobiia bacterium]